MSLTLPRRSNQLSPDSRHLFGVGENWNFGILRDVNWSDVDGNNHVNNLVFLRWCEDVRNRYWLEALGSWPDTSKQTFVLRSINFEYERGIRLGDHVLVTARTAKIGTTSWKQKYAVWNGDCVGQGEAVCIFVDEAGLKIPIGPDVRDVFLRMDPDAG